jgi:protein transport protein SEC61 subunit gamma-like protein
MLFEFVLMLCFFLPFPDFSKDNNIKMEKQGFNEVLIEPLKQFAKDSVHLVKKCTKPDRKEFTKIAKATGVGFLIMGFIGFFVKLVHIPINNILVGN